MQFAPDAGRPKSENRDPARLKPQEGRLPPQDMDAEAAVLSAILLQPDVFDRVAEILQPEHFYADANRRVYEAITSIQQRSEPVDIVSVAGWLRDRERLDQIGGTGYLAQLTDATPAVAHVEAHAKVVRSKWRLRQLIGVCQHFAGVGYGDCGDVQEFIDQAEQSVFDIARLPEGSAVRPLKDAIHTAFDILSTASQRGDGITGMSTGFDRLDKQIAGLHEGDLYIIAGRPGMGKTSLVLNLAANVAVERRIRVEDPNSPFGETDQDRPGYGVAFFSLEMPREQLAARLLSTEGRVDVSRLRSGNLRPEDWNLLTDAASRLGKLPLWLDDTPALGLLELRAKVRRLRRPRPTARCRRPGDRRGRSWRRQHR
jgi:replicative DNA helicase